MKCGLVALIGRPNAGKSTLLNRLVGQKVAIISDKPQTTRHRIVGVRNEGDVQMVLVDTPGVHRPGFRLNESMMETVYEALREVDVVVHMVDASEAFGKGEQYVLDLVCKLDKALILVLNKVDQINKAKVLPMIEFFGSEAPYREIIPLSALNGDNVDVLIKTIAGLLPEGPWLYPEDYLTDQPERVLVAEIIREKVLRHTRQELPFSTAVLVEDFDESQRDTGFVRILASILVEKDGQKKIVVGRGGRLIKTIGIEARRDIENLLDLRKVFLGLTVRVEPDWRNRVPLLIQLGVR